MHIDNITSEKMTLDNDGKAMQISVYEKEIERLNNIIEELEKDMRETIEIIKNTEYQKIDIDYVIETFDIYCSRLKELKDKNE